MRYPANRKFIEFMRIGGSPTEYLSSELDHLDYRYEERISNLVNILDPVISRTEEDVIYRMEMDSGIAFGLACICYVSESHSWEQTVRNMIYALTGKRATNENDLMFHLLGSD